MLASRYQRVEWVLREAYNPPMPDNDPANSYEDAISSVRPVVHLKLDDPDPAQLLGRAMAEAQVDVCGMGRFGARDVAREVIAILRAAGYELTIRAKELSGY